MISGLGSGELTLHALLRCVASDVEVHPTLEHTDARPDFRFTESAHLEAYLEATVATDESEEEAARRKVREVFFDQVDKADLPKYFLHIEEIGNPRQAQPSGRKFRRFLRKVSREVDYEDLVKKAQGPGWNLPSWTYKERELQVRFSLIPKAKDKIGKTDHRPIGMFPAKSRWGGTSIALRSAINRKAGRYGKLGAPYIIAVNSVSEWGTGRDDIEEALFGDEVLVVDGVTRERELQRNREGVWMGPNGPQYTRVSAVLVGTVFPWNLPRAQISLIHNRWAEHEYVGGLQELPQMRMEDNGFVWTDGKTLGELLSLDQDWPGDLFADDEV